jgi:hypothetical protein
LVSTVLVSWLAAAMFFYLNWDAGAASPDYSSTVDNLRRL